MIALYGLTLFLSSALLFVLEPMFAKMVLPILGGTPAVWNVCMVFYQALLLAGYAYAHEFAMRFTPRCTALIQVVIVFAALFALPVRLPYAVTQAPLHSPTLWLLEILTLGVAVPFFVLTTYSSTLQRWYASTSPRRTAEPYVLYSAGNLGSMVGLLSYPLLIERHLGLTMQSRLWQHGYSLLLLLTACCALTLWMRPEASTPGISRPERYSAAPIQEAKWLFLAFIPSSLMLGVTTALTTELPPIPLLWVLPLAVYLLSFVLVFAAKPIAYHAVVVRKLPILLVVMLFLLASKTVLAPAFTVPVYLVVLFSACVACHGELAISRPPSAGLTRFYLCLAIGGALGGVFNALVAPVIFRSVVELPLALCLLAVAIAYMNPDRRKSAPSKWDFILPLGLGLLVAAGSLGLSALHLVAPPVQNLLFFVIPTFVCLSFAERPLRFALGFTSLLLASALFFAPYGHVLLADRSFFGVYWVADSGGYRELAHGTTLHGLQSLDPSRSREPLSYYYSTGPIGELFAAPSIGQRMHEVAVIGLGAGSLACYTAVGRHFTFYEIDPTVVAIARNPRYFTFLRDCSPDGKVIDGDARLSLRQAPPHKYDIIIADAFSSDYVPVHLVTKEAIDLYLDKLADHGLLAFNISNRYLDLRPVLCAVARNAGLECIVRTDQTISESEGSRGKFPSTWLVMARTSADLGLLASDAKWFRFQMQAGSKVWTDDYSSIADIMHWSVHAY